MSFKLEIQRVERKNAGDSRESPTAEGAAASSPSQEPAIIATSASWNEAAAAPYLEAVEGSKHFNKQPTANERCWFLAMAGVELVGALVLLCAGFVLMAASSGRSGQGTLMTASGCMQLMIALFLLSCSVRARYTAAALMLSMLLCVGSALFHTVLLVAVVINELVPSVRNTHLPSQTQLFVAIFCVYVLATCSLVVLSVGHFLLHIRFCHYHFEMPADETIGASPQRSRHASSDTIIDAL